MASGYQSNGYDLDIYCESYAGGKPVSKSGYDLSGYKINGESITSRYNKPSTDEWVSSVNTFYSHGESVPICRIGRLPTQTKFAEITSAGTYNITWDSSGLTIGSTTYPASSFRNGKVPEYIGIIIAGAGGGGGGFGADLGDKNGYNRKPSGAGGGGGVGAYVISLIGRKEEPMLHQVVIGAGGSGGSWSDSSDDARPSTGGAGGSGGVSKIICREKGTTVDIVVVTANGGSGGAGGVGDGGTSTSGGSGGTVTTSMGTTTAGNPYGYYRGSCAGGSGGSYNSSSGSNTGGGATSLTSFSFTTDAGVPTSTMFNNASSSYSWDSSDGYRNTWNGGGASFGNGGTNSTAPTKGGGGCSNSNSSGASGYCAFYY